MSLYEWLLFFHVLAAFALVAGVVAYGVLVLGDAGPVARQALAQPALVLWSVGGGGVLILGIWLALDVDGYELWDGWILAAIVLWFVASGAGGPLSRAIRDAPASLVPRRARLLYLLIVLATAALLADMIFKPGA